MPQAAMTQTVSVETPELVVLSYTVAGVGSRAVAAIIDYFIAFAALFTLGLLLALLGAARRGFGISVETSDVWVLAFFVIGQFVVLWGYYVLFEGLADGRTPGKRAMRLRVVMEGGYSVTFAASAVRNLVRVVDMQPVFTYGVGIASILFNKSAKRLGDIVAGTIVVREELVKRPAAAEPRPRRGEAAAAALHTALADTEYDVLDRYAQRRSELDPGRRTAIAEQLAARFARALEGVEGTSDAARLMALYAAEREARAQGVSARHETGAARERHAIVATGSPRWTAFAAVLARAQSGGLRSLGEQGIRDFVTEYRALTADLARLQTAARGRGGDELVYLSRLVAGAHNLLYRGKSLTPYDAVRFLTVDTPREVRRSWRPIVFAAALVFGPAAIAYTAVVEQPGVATIFIPPSMMDRAEQGIRRAREGEGYIPDPQIFRPVMATGIIANNVQVTFFVFALGVTAGIGTLLLLLFNGVSLGGVFGLYQSKGIATLLLAFVAPHGVLELTAVCIAGGGGFLLAAALLMPGRRTRRTALVENGRRAIRLIGASSALLVVAGTLEGFVSPIPWWPLEGKLAVSGLTLVGLAVYLRAGKERRVAIEEPPESPEKELLTLGSSVE